MNILVLHGPNLNLLGERPGDVPGRTLEEIDQAIAKHAAQLGVIVKVLQSNHEGALIDALHEQRHWADGVIINPAALGPTSYALRDALAGVAKPAFEVHLVDIRRGEPWRRKSVLKEVCTGQIVGKGIQSYLLAMERLVAAEAKASGKGKRAPRAGARAPVALTSPPPAALVKTLGRKPAAATVLTRALHKTLGKAAALSGAEGRSLSRASQVGFLTRALVRQKIAERLSGKLTAAGLATWARTQWQEVQRGAPAESGQRDLLEDLLQSLLLAPAQPLSDDQLIELMTRLDG